MNSDPPVPCGPGTYKPLPGAGSCDPCPANFACPNPDGDKYACPDGMLSEAGSTGCKYPTTEEILATSPAATTGYVACVAGMYSFPETNKCVNCPKGHECPTLNMLPVPCPAGWYADIINSVACAFCPPNYKCPTPYKSEVCTAGFYSPKGSTNCYPVPGWMKRDTASDDNRPMYCTDGEYSAVGVETCTECPADSECPSHNLGQIVCNTDRHTFFSPAASKTCYPTYMRPDNNVGATASTYVAPGSFGWKGATTPLLCPWGHQCTFDNEQMWIECPPGYYSPADSRICQPCPSNVHCW